MAIVDYLSVDFDVSPRIIWIDTTSSTSISVQNLIDTCMTISAQAANMDDAILLESSGKEYLVADGSVKVGLTVTLNNAKIAFKSLGGPDWVLCSIEGGNVVAVEDIYTSPRVYIPVIHPTAFISVERVSSSSATLSELSAIQYASFGGGVTIDVINGISGTAFPIGTKETPVDNLIDAVAIANERGFDVLYISNSMNLDSGTDIIDFKIIGKSATRTNIIIDPSAICNNINIQQANISGTLDGGTEIVHCSVGDLTYVNGHIHDSGLYGVIILDGNKEAVITDCYTVDQDNTPTIDMGGSGQDLMVLNYSGIINVRNLDSTSEEIGIGIDAGLITLEDTISAGTIIISGVGRLVNNTTGTASVDTDGLMSVETITKTTWNKVYIDTIIGVSGTVFPIGTFLHPVSNIADAISIANANNIKILYFNGSENVSGSEDLSGLTVIAERSLNNILTITNAITAETYFENLTVSGTMSGSVRYTTCVMGAINNFDGGAKNCLLTGNINITGNGANYFTDCDTYVTDGSYKQIDIGDKLLNIIRCRGMYEIINYTGLVSVAIDLVAGHIKVASSCVSGFITVGGLVNLINESAAGCTVVDATLTETGTAAAVADEDIIKSINKNTKLIPGLL